jgi:uncharacterized membrane protein YfhO
VDYPGWKATVDARPTPVVRTDYVLRAVRIPAGRHVVRFDFAPRSLRFGTAATLVAAAALVVIVAVWRRRADSPRAEPTARGREDVPPL